MKKIIFILMVSITLWGACTSCTTTKSVGESGADKQNINLIENIPEIDYSAQANVFSTSDLISLKSSEDIKIRIATFIQEKGNKEGFAPDRVTDSIDNFIFNKEFKYVLNLDYEKYKWIPWQNFDFAKSKEPEKDMIVIIESPENPLLKDKDGNFDPKNGGYTTFEFIFKNGELIEYKALTNNRIVAKYLQKYGVIIKGEIK